MKPKICILKADGTNCDEETAYAFTKAGGVCTIVTINSLRSKRAKLTDFDILAIPGGFSYGDDIASGKVLAIELLSFLKEQLTEFVQANRLIIGICNGFQVLVRTGLLPFKSLGSMQATLLHNKSGSFECRWVRMIVQESPCVFTKSLIGQEITLPVAHAEGNFFTDEVRLDKLESKKCIALRYSSNGVTTQQFPNNPNGSLNAVAGICDETGRIFGLMPHPERFTEQYHYPNWRQELIQPIGQLFFENAIRACI